MVDLVIFDCDGVLVDSELTSARVLIETLAGIGVHLDIDHIKRHFLGRSFPTVAASVARDFDVALPEGFEERYRSSLLAQFESGLGPTPGLHDVLAQLTVPACVATSSSPRRVARSLQIVGLDDIFGDAVFTSSEVAHGKPAPDLFLHAARRMGVASDRCLVIEDSGPGLAAAAAAGMPSLHYVGGAHLRGDPSAGQGGSVGRLACWSDLPEQCPALFATGPQQTVAGAGA